MLTFASTGTYAQTPKTIPLLPEVKAILNTPAPDKQVLKKDVYAALLGASAPEGTDYMEIGAQVILNNYHRFQMALKQPGRTDLPEPDAPENYYPENQALKPSLEIDGKFYQIPCANIHNAQCVADTLKDKQIIEQLLADRNNQLSIERFNQIRQLPYFSSYLYSLDEPLPRYHHFNDITKLRTAQAVLAITEGRIDKGLAILSEEQAFARRMVTQSPLIIERMIGIVQYFTVLNTVSALMDTQEMKPYLNDPRLIALLKPLNAEEQTTMAQTFAHEFEFGLRTLYTMSDEELQYLYFGEKQGLDKNTYERNATANLRYVMLQPLIARAAMTMDEIATLKAKDMLPLLEDQMQQAYEQEIARQQQLRQNDPQLQSNSAGEDAMQNSSDWQSYMMRFYDLQSYLKLVALKHQILQANVPTDQIGHFILQAGQAGQNPITGEPFRWDESAGTISTPWLASSGGPAGARVTQTDSKRPNTVYLQIQH